MKIETGSILTLDDFGSIQCPTCSEIVPLGIAEDTNTYTFIHCDKSVKLIPATFKAVIDKITPENVDSVLEYNTLEEEESEEEDEEENEESDEEIDQAGEGESEIINETEQAD